MSSFSPKYKHYKFISACTVLSIRFLTSFPGQAHSFLTHFPDVAVLAISYFKRIKGECTGCSPVLEVPWSSSKDTLLCFSSPSGLCEVFYLLPQLLP